MHFFQENVYLSSVQEYVGAMSIILKVQIFILRNQGAYEAPFPYEAEG